jgi:hypothetical protein
VDDQNRSAHNPKGRDSCHRHHHRRRHHYLEGLAVGSAQIPGRLVPHFWPLLQLGRLVQPGQLWFPLPPRWNFLSYLFVRSLLHPLCKLMASGKVTDEFQCIKTNLVFVRHVYNIDIMTDDIVVFPKSIIGANNHVPQYIFIEP